MSTGFYEILGSARGSNTSDLERAVTLRLDGLRRRLDGAQQRGDPDFAIRSEIGRVREAWSVLSDPARRVAYDRFAALGEDLPVTAQELAKEVFISGMDGPTRTASALVGALTTLNLEFPAMTNQAQPGHTYTSTGPTPGVHPHAVSVDTTLSHEFETTAPGEDEERASLSGAVPSAGQTVDEAKLHAMITSLGYSGALLLAVREARGLTLEQIATQTHISLPYLQALEAEDLAKLPARTFVRGYLKSVSTVLGLEEGALVNGYLVRLAARRRGG